MKNWKAFQRRSLGLFLALVMLFGMIPVGTFAQEVEGAPNVSDTVENVTGNEEVTMNNTPGEDPAQTPMTVSSDITVYFRNDWLWDTVYIHYWGNGETSWPGIAMTKTGKTYYVESLKGDRDIYSVQIPAGVTGIIFNDGVNNQQTPNIESGIADGAAFYIYYDGGNKAASFDYDPNEGGSETPTPTETTYYVAGSNGLCSDNWNTTADKMVEQENGTWTITFYNIEAGEHKFKVTDGTWNATWGGSGDNSDTDGNYVFTVAAKSDVTITFNPDTKEITVSQKAVVETPSTKTIYLNPGVWFKDGATFSAQAWTGDGEKTDYTLTDEDGDLVYELTIPVDADHVQFFRKSSDGTQTWNESAELTIDNLCYVIQDWNNAAWSDSNQGPALIVVGSPKAVFGTEWSLDNTANTMTRKDDGTYAITYSNVAAGTALAFQVTAGSWDAAWGGSGDNSDDDGNYVYTVKKTGDVTISFNGVTKAITVTETAAGAEPDEKYHATFHFANSLNWSTVNLYTWLSDNNQLTGAWPGTALSQDENGFYSYTVDFTPEEGKGLNFIFSGGGVQTVDLNLPDSAFEDGKAEKWVKLTDKDGSKYKADILDTAPLVAVSPKVSGTSVTFEYIGDANTVCVAGSFNDWNTTATSMTKNDKGIWTVTVENVTPGEHTYKFVINDKTWIADPCNSSFLDANGNSQFTILNPDAEDTNQITLNVHFTKEDGTYEEGWNVYVWGSSMDGKRYELEDDSENGGKICTIVIDDARALTEIGAIVRLSESGNDWAKQCPDMKMDLTEIVSGTIDMYAEYDGTNWTCQTKLGSDVVKGIKLTSVQYDYDTGKLVVEAASKLDNAKTDLTLDVAEGAEAVTVNEVTENGKTYTLTLSGNIPLNKLYQYQVSFQKRTYAIGMGLVYSSDKFEDEFTYTGSDLGATYSATGTTFKVWAPTAEKVSVNLYDAGNDGNVSNAYTMTLGDKGVWALTVEGDLRNFYYTYSVQVNGKTVEVVDPYGRSAGVNGQRSMVTDLDSTDPSSWSSDSYVTCESITDAVIYETHVRDFTVNAGVEHSGKFLGVAEKGKTYLPQLGVTHVHLLPIYDFGSVDETKTTDYNWGYDPVNYNVPEGSYSTDASDGNVRVNEMKTMVQQLHSAGVGVIMDVVYNHVYDASSFSMNQIVPGYFSREDSNGSGCGNDTASERSMVRKYIVDSVTYWAKEYHIDGFRFDLVGLIDTETINQIVESVKTINPSAIFYGEGWTMGTNAEEGTVMATQSNASQTPGFAYFSDQMRNSLAGDNNGSSLGFASGASGKESTIAANFQANPSNIANNGDPTQVVQYASCHDNYTLMDKILLSTSKKAVDDEAIAMNNLTAAIYLTSQGAPFIHAGEELLREKVKEDGSRDHNSYNAGDGVNAIQWSNLNKDEYKATFAYYQGLIAFRKAHAALRLTSASEIAKRVTQQKAENGLVAFQIDGKGVDSHNSIYLIFNGSKNAQNVTLPAGSWDVCIDKDNAGTETLRTVSGTVSVPGTSALVLVQQESKDYYLVGYIDDKNYGIDDDYLNLGDYKFVNGKVTVTFTKDSYVMVKTGDNQNWYMTDGWLGNDVTEATLYNTNELGQNANKLYVPAGTVTFTLTAGENDTLILQMEPYYLTGYINGTDYSGNGYKFVNGKLTAKFTAATYLTVRRGNTTFYTDDWYDNMPNSITLYPEEKAGPKKNKWQVPTGVELTITLKENTDGSITLSYTKSELEDPDALYLWGTFDGVDTDDLSCKFEEVDGKLQLTKTFTKDSYVAVKNGDSSVQYMTDGYKGAVSSVKLYNKNTHTLVNDKFDKLLVPAGTITFTLVKEDDGSLTLSYTTSETGKTFQDKTGIQNGVTLHCWNWSFAEIEAHLDEIKAAGFTAIQTSPVQPVKETTASSKVGTHWWVYYQPVDFKINDSEGNALGTKTELQSMISAAHAKGIKVIVDVVANHLANQTGNDLSNAIPEYLHKDEYWHDITKNISNWSDRSDMTQHCMDGLPDLNTANKAVQGYVLDFLKECVDVGVDGFRFDAAKSIETPDDAASFASDFWPTVIGGVTEYAEGKGKGLYFYGETLDDIAIATSAYTQYMSITDNGWGNHLRTMLNGEEQGTPELKAGYYKSAAASNLVVWAESHDTYADDTSSGVSEDVINKTWALIAARKDAMGLYLARPESNDQLLGTASTTAWADPVVAAVNAFHNAYVGKSETVANASGFSYVVRGTDGAVLVATGEGTDVSVDAKGMADGSYCDMLTGNDFQVSDGILSGQIGNTGVAVVRKASKITVVPSDDGNIDVSDSVALPGETVTVTVTAGDHVHVKGLTVTSGETSIQVTANADGTYSFIQPDGKVTVEGIFAPYYDVTTKDSAVKIQTKEPEEGDKVYFTVTAPENTRIDQVTVKKVSRSRAAADLILVTDEGNGSYSYIQPSSDTEIVVTYSQLYKITLEYDSTFGTVTADKKIAKAGETVTVTVTPGDGYAIAKVMLNGTALTGKDGTYTFTQPEADATVEVAFQKAQNPVEPAKDYKITLKYDATAGSVTADKKTAKAGETVIVTVKPRENYAITKVTLNGTALTGKDGTYTFAQPEAEATVEVVFARYYTIVAQQTEDAVVTIAGSAAVAGQTVCFTVTPAENRVVTDISVTGKNGTKCPVTQQTDGSYTFTQPATDVTIAVTCAVQYPVSVKANFQGGQVKLSNSRPQNGQTVTVTVVRNGNVALDGLTATDATGKAVSLTKNSDGTYAFTQGESAVTLYVTYLQLYTVTVMPTEGGNVRVDSTCHAAGTTVTITAVAEEDSVIAAVTVTDDSGKKITTQGENGVYTFTQPESDVTVTVRFAPLYTVTIAKTQHGKITVSNDRPAAGEVVTISISPNSGKAVKKVTVTTASGEKVTLTRKNSVKYQFTQPDEDVTVSVTFADSNGSAATGDQSHIRLWIGVMAVTLVLLVLLAFFLVRSRKNKKK